MGDSLEWSSDAGPTSCLDCGYLMGGHSKIVRLNLYKKYFMEGERLVSADANWGRTGSIGKIKKFLSEAKYSTDV